MPGIGGHSEEFAVASGHFHSSTHQKQSHDRWQASEVLKEKQDKKDIHWLAAKEVNPLCWLNSLRSQKTFQLKSV